MRLRQKKTNNLSEDALYSQFQNQHFQTFAKKLDFNQKLNYNISRESSIMHQNKTSSAQILARFINNVNIAKHRRQKKVQMRPKIKNIRIQQYSRNKRMRKTSDNMSFDEQKKIQHPKSAFTNTNSISKKIKIQQKRERPSGLLSNNMVPQNNTDFLNLKKQMPQQNIINNFFYGNTLNLSDYSLFLQPNYFALNPAIWNSLMQTAPFIKPNLQNISFPTEQMASGYYRQMQIYDRFIQQPRSQDIQKKPLPFSSLSNKSPQKNEKKAIIPITSNKVSPDKIFKRASYHVAIAYSIYLDNIQKGESVIKSFNDIDPTRFAKKYKQNSKNQ